MFKKFFVACLVLSLVFSLSAMACLDEGGIEIILPDGVKVSVQKRADTEIRGYKVIFQGWNITIIGPDGGVYQSKILSVSKGGCGPATTGEPVKVVPRKY